MGTWISQDPLQYINGANTYQFVMGNPVGATDLLGLCKCCKPLGPAAVEIKTWTMYDIVRNPGWGNHLVFVKTDFELLLSNPWSLQVVLVGEGGEEGKFPPIHMAGTPSWSLPTDTVLWTNRGHLAGISAREHLYFVQKVKCKGKVETLYWGKWVHGYTALTMDNIGISGTSGVEGQMVEAAKTLNLCGIATTTTSQPSGLVPLSSRPGSVPTNYVPPPQ